MAELHPADTSQAAGSSRTCLVGPVPREVAAAWDRAYGRATRFVDRDAVEPWLAQSAIHPVIGWIWRAGVHSADHAEFERLFTDYPLVTWVSLTGDWQEGEQRSGYPLSGIWRVSVYEWMDAVRGEIRDYPVSWLPRTHVPSDAWLERNPSRSLGTGTAAPHDSSSPAETVKLAVGIVTQSRESFEMLAEVVRSLAAEPIWWEPREHGSGNEVAAVLVDFELGLENETERSPDWISVLPRPRIALVGFPRFQDACRLREWGFEALVPKPSARETLRVELLRGLNPDRLKPAAAD